MAVVIPTVIGQGWERHEFKFEIDVLPNYNSWQLFEVEPHPRNKDLMAQWCIQAEFRVSYKNPLLLRVYSKVLSQNRKNVFATVYIHFGNSTLHCFCKKECFSINRVKMLFFTGNKISLNTTIFATIISETGEKPGFTDILLSDVKAKSIRLSREKQSLTKKNNYCNGSWGYSHDFQEPTGNGSSSLYICNWEKFTYVFHLLKPQSIFAIEPSEIISEGSGVWCVRLKPEIDRRNMMSLQVSIQLLSNMRQKVFVKVMYVVDYEGKTIIKCEHSYQTHFKNIILCQLKKIKDAKNVVVKVFIVSDTGKEFREVYFSSPSNDGEQIENRALHQVYFEAKPDVSNSQAQAAMQKQFCSSGPILYRSDPSDKNQLTEERKSNHEAEESIVTIDLIGDVAGPSHFSYQNHSELRLSDESEFSEAEISSSSQRDNRCKAKLPDISTLSEVERFLDLRRLEEWKKRDHKYSVPILERFLYLYSINLVAESSSVQQYLYHKSEPKKASGSWKVEVKSSVYDNDKVNVYIAATLEKSEIDVLFARMLVFVFFGTGEVKYSTEKKQCLCVGESILNHLQIISIATNTARVKIVILSENPGCLLTHSCANNIDAASGSDQRLIQPVFIRSSTDILESDSTALCDCSPILQAIIQNFDSEDKDRVIRMTDFSSEVVQSVLTFVNGAKEVCWKRMKTEQIFKLSDKYGISELKEKCELHLMTLLDVENALELLLFAADNSAAKLRSSVLELVSSHGKYFKENNKYSILHKRPEIMQQLLEYLSDNRTSDRKRTTDSPVAGTKKKKETEEIR